MAEGAIIGSILFLRFIVFSSGVVLHLYTVFLSYKSFGIIEAVITFMAAGLAEIFWIYTMIKATGDVLNYYTIICVVWLVLVIIRVFTMSRFEQSI